MLRHWRKVFWLSVSIVLVMGAAVLLATFGPAADAATVETGASFSVSAGSFGTETKAATFAAALDASGLPIFVRARVDDGRYQVLVGPYVSTDEAERAQRKLAAWGLGEARLVVDDTMRARPQEAAIFGLGESTSNSVVLIAAPGMSSLVFEMQERPKAIEVKRTSATTIDVEIGRREGDFEPLTLPDGVVLVRDLSVQSADSASMHAHLVVPDGVESRLRLEGRRVYLDLAFPTAPWSIRHTAPVAKAPLKVIAAAAPDQRDEFKAAVARFDQIKPFLSSALQSPEPAVLAALGHSLDDLRRAVEKLSVARDVEGDRATLLAAINDASDEIKRAAGR